MSRWPINKASIRETAPFLRLLVPFAAGIWCYYTSPAIEAGLFYAAVTAIACGLLYIFLSILIKNGSRYWTTVYVLANAALFASGFTVAGNSDIRSNKRWFGHQKIHENDYLARIASIPDEKARTWKIKVQIIGSVNNESAKSVTGEALIYVVKDEKPMTLYRGDTVLLPGKWELIKDAGNPFEFEYANYCARNNLHYRQQCTIDDIRTYGIHQSSDLTLTEKMHDWCMTQLATYLGNHKSSGLLQAMLLGDEVNLDPELRREYTDTGIVHIIAISGGNVAIFFMVISFMLIWIRHKKHHWVRYLLSLPVIWFYVVMAGAQPSAIRAAAMFSILAFGIMMQKNTNPINQLLATAFILLCAVPAWLFSVGFQLSFVAVLSILLFYKPIFQLVKIPDPPKGRSAAIRLGAHLLQRSAAAIWSAATLSIAAEILVAPLVVYYFHTFPLLFIFANIIAYLFMSIVLVSGMILILVSPVTTAALFIAAVIKWMVALFERIIVWMQQKGPENLSNLVLTQFEIIWVYLLIICLSAWLMRKKKLAVFASILCASLLTASFCHNQWERIHQEKLVYYNSSGGNRIEYILGQKVYQIKDASDSTTVQDYAAKTAHIGWKTDLQARITNREVFLIGDKTALVLHKIMKVRKSFPVDVLMIAYDDDWEVNELMKYFSPKCIVTSNLHSQIEDSLLRADCKRVGIRLHNVSTVGAFVLGNNGN